MRAQISKASGYSRDREYAVPPGVTLLLRFGGPFAVSRLVIAGIIYAVNACALWGFSHVSKEIGKGVNPPDANLNSSAPVVFPLGKIGVLATVLNPPPCSVSSCGAGCLAVFGSHLKGEATARTGFSFGEVVAAGNDFLPALALAPEPFNRSRFGSCSWCFGNDRKASELAANNALPISHCEIMRAQQRNVNCITQ